MLVLSAFSVASVRTFFKACQLKSWRSQAPPQGERKPGYRAVAKRKGAYAAMLGLSVFFVPSVRTLYFDLWNERKPGVSGRREKKGRLRRDARVG